MCNARWQNNYTAEARYPLFLATRNRDLNGRHKPSVAAWDRTSQPSQYFFWQGTGCSDSKTYASKILSLRFPSFFLPSPPSLLSFLPHCIYVAEGRQGLQAAALKWQIGKHAPSGTGTLALLCQWVMEGLGKGAWTFASSIVSCSNRGAAVTELGELEDAALTNSGV